jgi:DNA-binding LacI/PurR family transcriptional regulator
MAGIKEVAGRAGVSIATVSHVLNGTRQVLPATEERVLEAVRALGYRPNAAARNLALGQSRLLGLMVSDICNPFFPEILKAFQDQANLRDMEAIVMNTNYDSHRTLSGVNRLLGLQVPGVAVMTSQVDPSVIQQLASHGICAVYLDLGRVDRFISNVIVDCEHGIEKAVDHLCGLGHVRLGYIGGPAHLQSSSRRKEAFLNSAARVRTEVRTVDADFSVQGGYFACSRLLAGFAATAIVAANDLMAIGAMHCVYDRGLRIPADVSVVGFDDITFSQFTQPALTTVAVSRQTIGCLAFQALSQMLDDPQHQGSEYRVETGMVIRQSTAPLGGEGK